MTNTPAIEIRCLDDEARDHPVLSALQDYWCSLNGGAPPRRKAFEFMDVYQLAPHLLMSERIAPRTFTFIYCGIHVAENFPLDLTGKTFSPDSVEVSRIPWFDYKSEALDVPCIRYGRDAFDWPNVDFDTILYGVFPLSDADGKMIYPLACFVFQSATPEALSP
jgi:hypothetical protein